MASVKQFPGSKFWYACYKVPTGETNLKGRPVYRRVQRSTKLEDKEKAGQVATSFERASKLATGRDWAMSSAKTFLLEVSALTGVQVAEVQETEEFFRQWLELAKLHKRKSEKTRRNYEGIIDDFLEFLGAKSKGPLSNINTPAVLAFRDSETRAGKSTGTVNKAIGVLGQVFGDAVLRGVMLENPVRKGVLIPGAQKDAQERSPFTFEQFRQLLKATDPAKNNRKDRREVHPEWQTFLYVTGYTGGRQQEPATLEWDNVHFETKEVGLRRTKSGDIHWMPLHAALEKHLRLVQKRAKGGSQSKWVMPYIAEQEGQALSKCFREVILPRIGIDQPYETRATTKGKGVGRKLAPYSIHSFRHALNTWLNDKGVSELNRMRIVGHEDKKVSRKYTHTERAQAASEMAKIDSV